MILACFSGTIRTLGSTLVFFVFVLFPLYARAIDSPQSVELADPSLASTPAKRQDLTYLVRCALSPSVTLYSRVGNGLRSLGCSGSPRAGCIPG
jgi:hypothetical protein